MKDIYLYSICEFGQYYIPPSQSYEWHTTDWKLTGYWGSVKWLKGNYYQVRGETELIFIQPDHGEEILQSLDTTITLQSDSTSSLTEFEGSLAGTTAQRKKLKIKSRRLWLWRSILLIFINEELLSFWE